MLSKLRETGLNIDIKKYKFFIKRIEFLNLNLINNNLELNLNKIKVMTSYYKQVYLKKLYESIRFYYYYRRFIRRFSYLTRLLSKLTRKKFFFI